MKREIKEEQKLKVARVVRFMGIVMPVRLCVCRALRRLYGVGRVRALQLCQLSCVEPAGVVGALGGPAISRLRRILSRSLFGVPLERYKDDIIAKHKKIGTARGRRHRVGLPVRGQRTRTNASTRKRRGKQKNKKR
jgi:small subunit ribosomal protein S13